MKWRKRNGENRKAMAKEMAESYRSINGEKLKGS